MIVDTNNIVALTYNTLVGSTSGDWMLLAVFFMIGIAMALIYARAKASTAVAVFASVAIMFSFILKELQFIWWVALIIAIFVLINGLRKWVTSQA